MNPIRRFLKRGQHEWTFVSVVIAVSLLLGWLLLPTYPFSHDGMAWIRYITIHQIHHESGHPTYFYVMWMIEAIIQWIHPVSIITLVNGVTIASSIGASLAIGWAIFEWGLWNGVRIRWGALLPFLLFTPYLLLFNHTIEVYSMGVALGMAGVAAYFRSLHQHQWAFLCLSGVCMALSFGCSVTVIFVWLWLGGVTLFFSLPWSTKVSYMGALAGMVLLGVVALFASLYWLGLVHYQGLNEWVQFMSGGGGGIMTNSLSNTIQKWIMMGLLMGPLWILGWRAFTVSVANQLGIGWRLGWGICVMMMGIFASMNLVASAEQLVIGAALLLITTWPLTQDWVAKYRLDWGMWIVGLVGCMVLGMVFNRKSHAVEAVLGYLQQHPSPLVLSQSFVTYIPMATPSRSVAIYGPELEQLKRDHPNVVVIEVDALLPLFVKPDEIGTKQRIPVKTLPFEDMLKGWIPLPLSWGPIYCVTLRPLSKTSPP